ncbi:D-aminoacyl-tRNA deacylase [Dermatophilaceae bacterium Sec6.4]
MSDPGAPVLVVSQFTLSGDARRGRGPSWSVRARSRPATHAEPLIHASTTTCGGWGWRWPPDASARPCRSR